MSLMFWMVSISVERVLLITHNMSPVSFIDICDSEMQVVQLKVVTWLGICVCCKEEYLWRNERVVIHHWRPVRWNSSTTNKWKSKTVEKLFIYFLIRQTGGGLSAKRKQFSLFFDDGRFQNIMEIQILKKISWGSWTTWNFYVLLMICVSRCYVFEKMKWIILCFSVFLILSIVFQTGLYGYFLWLLSNVLLYPLLS